jgi:hypothetical protein
MAKRYHNGNGNGMKSMESRDLYSGKTSRREMESRDAGMISEDKSAIANLPQNVIMKAYPACAYDSYNLNDDIKGIDVQVRDDVMGGKRKSGMPYPEKY